MTNNEEFNVDMSGAVAENICIYLRSKDIQLSPENNWLNNCIDWFRSHLELVNIYGSLQDYVWMQYTLADLRDVKCGCFPTICRDRIVDLPGRYLVQINWIRDIAQSCYSQLQAVQNVNYADSNDNLTIDEQKKQNWEPSPKRVLLMEVTDGVTTLKAMEYSPIPKLAEYFLPGLKAVLIGPIECRKGILFLKSNNIDILGGEVDYLYNLNCKEVLLSRCLNIVTNHEVIQERDRNGPTTLHHTQSNAELANRTQLLDNLEEVVDSVSVNACSTFVREREILMEDEDDYFLCQLPDEVLHCESSISKFELHELSNGSLNNSSNQAIISESGTHNTTPSSHDALVINKSKPVPSTEGIKSVDREIMSSSSLVTNDVPFKPYIYQSTDGITHLPSTTHTNLSASIVNKCQVEIQSKQINKSDENLCNLNGSLGKQKNLHSNLQNTESNVQRTIEDSIDSVIINRSNYPRLKVLHIKVELITKLKIRSGEWLCCATAVYEGQSLDVTFSNKVLEKLFGISAAEVEVWRGEMTTNPSLKKKVNNILKTGQTKLKTLNCPMTLEYSSEHGTPEIVDIHVL